MADGNGFTPTERRIMDVLADGMKHKRDELMACIGDEMATPTNLSNHISRLRRKLNPVGRDIVCHAFGWSRLYQVVIMISTDDG